MTMLKEKVVLVTGAGSGVGRATALVCAREGAHVAVIDVDVDSSEETVRQVRETGREAAFIQADVTRSDQMEAAVRKSVETFGRLDCAFNNAGVVIDEPVQLTDYSEDAWELPSDMSADIDDCFCAKWGAISIRQYDAELRAAGFTAVDIVDAGADLNAYVQMDTQTSCCVATSVDADHYARFAAVLRKYDVNPYIASVNVFAVKP